MKDVYLGKAMKSTEQEYRKYLSPKVLARLSGLELRARVIIEGFIGGMHRSPHHGLSIEYADHRAYTQGDDLKHIDWKVYGRTDKFYIKEYEQETNLNIVLVVDRSESMAYSSSRDGLSKYDYAASLAAAVAYLASIQHDAAGLVSFDEKITQYIRPSNHTNHWKSIVRELSGGTGPAKTRTGAVLSELAERLSGRMLILIISDLFDEEDAIVKGLRKLRYRRHDLVVWNIWDEAELTLPLSGATMFEGMEGAGHLLSDPKALRHRYMEEVKRFQDRMRTACGRLQIDYTVFSTASALDAALTGYLSTRSARLRQRSSRVMGSS